jgi:hypothetical protein
MNDSWISIYTDTDVQHIYILHALLESEGIKSTILNKASSSYPLIGEAELLVEAKDAEKADEIIKSHAKGQPD